MWEDLHSSGLKALPLVVWIELVSMHEKHFAYGRHMENIQLDYKYKHHHHNHHLSDQK